MSEWLFVILMMVSGIVLLVLEIIFLPGGIVGLLGGVILLVGNVLAFVYFGVQIGMLAGGLTLVFVSAAFLYAFRARVWERFSLKQRHTAQARKPLQQQGLRVGMKGMARSALRPVGKGLFAGEMIEIKTLDAYIAAGTEIEIIKISDAVYVKPLKS